MFWRSLSQRIIWALDKLKTKLFLVCGNPMSEFINIWKISINDKLLKMYFSFNFIILCCLHRNSLHKLLFFVHLFFFLIFLIDVSSENLTTVLVIAIVNHLNHSATNATGGSLYILLDRFSVLLKFTTSLWKF